MLTKIRAGEALTAKDKTIHEQGLVSVLQTLHDELDAAVLAAYGWSDLTAVIPAQAGIQNSTAWTPACAGVTDEAFREEILTRLVALNPSAPAKKPPATSAGCARPSRTRKPAFAAVNAEKTAKNRESAEDPCNRRSSPRRQRRPEGSPLGEKSPWPATLPEQMALLARLLASRPRKAKPTSPPASPAKARGKNASPTSCKPSSPSAAHGRRGKRGMAV